mgnify:CR=1 FL=1
MLYKNFYDDLLCQYNELASTKNEIEKNLKNAPTGKIKITINRNHVQYYLRTTSSDKSGKYLRKSNMKLITKLLQKSYYEKALSLITKEMKYLEVIFQKAAKTRNNLKYLYTSYPKESQPLIQPLDLTDEEFAKIWSSKPFTTKGIAEGKDIYYTDKGEAVRSKSELNIANTLSKNGIPYKYEAPLLLKNGTTIYPDFTVLNVKSRKVVYWEHRGMMDDRSYATSSVQRLKEMISNDIVIGKNLIITEETLTNPLSTKEITTHISQFL